MTVSKGSEYTVNASGTAQVGFDCARISDTQMLTAYSSAPASPNFGSRVVNINTGTKVATPQAEYIFAHGSQLDELQLAFLSSTEFMAVNRVGKAWIVNVAGTVVTLSAIQNITSFSIFGALFLEPLTSTTALYVYGDGADLIGRVLTKDGSDVISEGSAVTLTSASTQVSAYSVIMFSPTSGAVFYQDDAATNYYLVAQYFTVTGITIATVGSVQSLYNTKVGWNTSVSTAFISDTMVVVTHDVEAAAFTYGLACHVITRSGSNLSAGATLEIPEAQLQTGISFMAPRESAATNLNTILVNGGAGSNTVSRTLQLIRTGTALSYTTNDFVDITTTAKMAYDVIKFIATDFALCCTIGTKQVTIIGSDSSALFSGYDLVLGGGQL